MRKVLGFVAMLIVGCSVDAFGQASATSNPEPSPTPRPAAKRRTFDQFDLSNGVSVTSPTSSSGPGFGSSKSSPIEFVDDRTYTGIRRLADHVDKMGAEYRASLTGPVDPNDWRPLSSLNRNLNAAYKVTELLYDGILDQPIKNPLNRALIEESQTTLREAMSTAAISGGWSKNETMLARMAEKYGAEVSGIEETRRAVLVAMLARLNANFARLLGQVAVQKSQSTPVSVGQ